MKNKKAIADIKIYKDSTVDVDIERDKGDVSELISGLITIVQKICGDDIALLYTIISSIIVITGANVNEIKEGIDKFEQQ